MASVCKRWPLPQDASLKTVFPAFTSSDMLIEVESHGLQYLANMHFCSKSQTVTKLNSLTSGVVDTGVRDVANRFMKQIYEHNECSVYTDLVDAQATVDHHGN